MHPGSHVTGVNPEVTRFTGPIVFADPAQQVTILPVLSPTGTGVSRIPLISWPLMLGVVFFDVRVSPESASPGAAPTAEVDLAGWRNSYRFGNVAGPGILLSRLETRALAPNTNYVLIISAVNANGTVIARNSPLVFQTGP